MNPRVAIIILNWNGKEDTIECLESLKHITYPNYEILLVDNGSADGSVECFRKRYPGMEIIENGENLGFAEGNNVGIRRAMAEGADYVLLLNNDTVVDPEFLGELVKVAEGDARIGIVGPKIYYYNSKILQTVGNRVIVSLGQPFLRGLNEEDTNQYETICEVDSIPGCALLIKKEVITKIGLLDFRYFAYFEDMDWNLRANRAGYKIKIVPMSKIQHKGSASTKLNSPLYYYLHTRNRILFVKRHSSYLKNIFIFTPYFIFIRFLFPITKHLIISRKIENAQAIFHGSIDGIKDKNNYRAKYLSR